MKHQELDKNKCNCCGGEFGTDGVIHQTAKNRKHLAKLDENGEVLQECCEQCVLDIEAELEE